MPRRTFMPLREDGRARWKVVFDMALGRSPGETLTYSELQDELLTKDRSVIYRACQRANRELWEKAQRSIDVIPDVGYRVLLPTEHEQQAQAFKKQSRRKLSNAVMVAQAVNWSALTDQQRDAAIEFAAGLVLMAQAVDRHEAMLKKHDDLIRRMAKKMKLDVDKDGSE